MVTASGLTASESAIVASGHGVNGGCASAYFLAYLVKHNVMLYIIAMIISFRHKGIESFFKTGSTRAIQASHTARLVRILSALDAAANPDELALPSFKLHPLKGRLKGHWSIWVNGNWRITFRFEGHDIELVDYLDYH